MPAEPLVDEHVLFALDEAVTMFPVERAGDAQRARYLGWRILYDVGYINVRFDPRLAAATRRWMCRYTDEACAELTHRYCDRMTPGARLYWVVEVDD